MLSAARALRQFGCSTVRGVAAATQRHQHTLPTLPYSYDSLEPVISREIMEIHYSKHHATYVANLNNAEKQLKECLEKEDISGTIAVQSAMKFNGGGHINHSIFWKNLTPNSGGEPTGELLDAIKRDFGSVDAFRNMMTAKTVAVQGSGWGWLGYNQQFKRLEITTCANQDPLQATTGLVPLLGIDVWEHAYYLQYKNVRPDYVKKIWSIINWEDVSSRYTAASK